MATGWRTGQTSPAGGKFTYGPCADLLQDGSFLQQVQRFARGRETPVALERNPITQAESDEILSSIRRNNPDIPMTFWEVWLEPE